MRTRPATQAELAAYERLKDTNPHKAAADQLRRAHFVNGRWASNESFKAWSDAVLLWEKARKDAGYRLTQEGVRIAVQ